jgi:hypothetical protein
MIASSVANSASFKATSPSDREIVLTRLFDVPRSLVFEAMTKPEHGMTTGASQSYDRLEAVAKKLLRS